MVKVFRCTTRPNMRFLLQPWQLLFVILAAWINHRQQQVNDFQRVQIEALLKAHGKK